MTFWIIFWSNPGAKEIKKGKKIVFWWHFWPHVSPTIAKSGIKVEHCTNCVNTLAKFCNDLCHSFVGQILGHPVMTSRKKCWSLDFPIPQVRNCLNCGCLLPIEESINPNFSLVILPTPIIQCFFNIFLQFRAAYLLRSKQGLFTTSEYI